MSSESTTTATKTEIENLIETITQNNHAEWNNLFNAINSRVQSLQHLALRSWNLDASCYLSYLYFKYQTEVQKYANNWSHVYSNRNVEQAKAVLRDYFNFLKKIDQDLLSKHFITSERYNLPDGLTSNLLSEIKTSFENISAQTSSELKKGIDNVISLKSSLNLTGSFETEISEGHRHSQIKYWSLFAAQIVLIAIVIAMTSTFALNVKYSEANFWQIIVVKGLIAIPIIAIWGLLNAEFKITRLEFVKMKHLISLINGGAVAVPQMVNESPSAKHDALSKIADAFVDIQQVISTVDKSSKSQELNLKQVINLADKISARVTNQQTKD